MAIKTSISADADPEALEASLALLKKYETALTKLYGRDVRRAPYLQAAATAGREAKEAADFLQRLERAGNANASSHER